MTEEDIIQLLEEDGFIEQYSPNKYMRHFKDTDKRIVDYYFTTGTIVIQWSDKQGKVEVIRRGDTKYNPQSLHNRFVC